LKCRIVAPPSDEGDHRRKNLVSHAGTALLSELADRSGLTDAMSGAMSGCGINWHTTIPVSCSPIWRGHRRWCRLPGRHGVLA